MIVLKHIATCSFVGEKEEKELFLELHIQNGEHLLGCRSPAWQGAAVRAPASGCEIASVTGRIDYANNLAGRALYGVTSGSG